ncbi:MAG: UbiA family prenyltransferase [Minisyncoccota bacterium]
MVKYIHMLAFFRRIITAIENAPLTLTTFVSAFFALILFRLLIENMLSRFQEHTFSFFFFEFTHTFLFFLCAFLLILPLVRYAGKTDFRKSTNILLFGFLIILTPPIIDTIIFHSGYFWSFYEFDGFLGLIRRFFTLFGDTPEIGITYGTRTEVVLVTLALGAYTLLKSQKVIKAFLVALGVYTILFILGTFPSWLTLGILMFQKSFFAINQNDVAVLFLAPEHIFSHNLADFRSVLNAKMSIVYGILAVLLIGMTVWREYPQYFRALWHNARLPQLIYHAGLLFIGMALAFSFTDTSLNTDFFHLSGALALLIAVECAWIASVIVNDLYDITIDRVTNCSRPLISNTIPPTLYKTYGLLFFGTSLILGGIVHFSVILLLLAYQAIAWIYSAPPFRFKRIPGIATILAASAGILILSTGFLVVSSENGIQALPFSLLLFLFIAYALAIPIKDFKDIRGDAIDHVYTIPVLLGAQNAKLFIGSLVFLLYLSSPFVLNTRELLVPALIFGSLTFWSLQQGTDTELSFFAYRKLPGIILSITMIYGLVLTYALF